MKQITDVTTDKINKLYNKYNSNSDIKPTLRHANYKLMKKYDIEDEGYNDEDTLKDEIERSDDEENFPTAVYTVYNVHGEPIGHRLYSYQPAYEPEDSDILGDDDSIEYKTNESIEENPHITVLRGGMFPDHQFQNIPTQKAGRINKLKHQYFARYIDKRRKRFLTQVSNGSNDDDLNIERKNLDIDLEQSESKIDFINIENKLNFSRSKRDVSKVVKHNGTSTAQHLDKYSNEVIPNDNLSVIPLSTKSTFNDSITSNDSSTEQKFVIPLYNIKTNSTEVQNVLDKKDKRTSRKSDRLNQTSTVPKT